MTNHKVDAEKAAQSIRCLTCDQGWADEYVVAGIVPDLQVD